MANVPAHILLVDDDRFILNHVSHLLEGQGCRCTSAICAGDAWQALVQGDVDLMVLDIGLPDVDGLSFCRRVRNRFQLPIIMLTARDSSFDKIAGMELGADDYVVKPFDSGELIARVRAHIRRVREYDDPASPSSILTIRGLALDLQRKEARRNGVVIPLTPLEFELLHALVRNSGRVLSRDWLFENVWGWESELGGQTLAVAVRRLRCKIEPDPTRPTYIQNVRGFGYMLARDAEG